MYGSSDPGYQGTLQALTAKQRESNTARTAAHEAAQTEAFMTGFEAKTNTVGQAACINELVGLIKTHPRLTENDKQIPFVIAVDRWSPGMMGRAAAAVESHDDLGYASMFLGVSETKVSRRWAAALSCVTARHRVFVANQMEPSFATVLLRSTDL